MLQNIQQIVLLIAKGYYNTAYTYTLHTLCCWILTKQLVLSFSLCVTESPHRAHRDWGFQSEIFTSRDAPADNNPCQNTTVNTRLHAYIV